MTQLRRSIGGGPQDLSVYSDDGYYLGDVMLEPDGSWSADITEGHAAPRGGFATRDEAIAFVLA